MRNEKCNTLEINGLRRELSPETSKNKNDIKMCLALWMNSCGLGDGSVAVPLEHGKEPPDSTACLGVPVRKPLTTIRLMKQESENSNV
jgi:hypothetical protein